MDVHVCAWARASKLAMGCMQAVALARATREGLGPITAGIAFEKEVTIF